MKLLVLSAFVNFDIRTPVFFDANFCSMNNNFTIPETGVALDFHFPTSQLGSVEDIVAINGDDFSTGTFHE